MVDPTGDVAHLIQTALTPVFLLSAIGSLLSLFNTRLARVSDHLSHAAQLVQDNDDPSQEARLRRHVTRLARRIKLLDTAIALGAVGGASTCGAAFQLFVGAIRQSVAEQWLIAMFAVALACTVGSLVVFLADSVVAWHVLRREGPLPKRVSS